MVKKGEMKAFEDPENRGNSDIHHTGKLCTEVGCDNPAGTWWSPHWCFPCNVKRMQRIGKHLESMMAKKGEKG